jgi:hypothetical protein
MARGSELEAPLAGAHQLSLRRAEQRTRLREDLIEQMRKFARIEGETARISRVAAEGSSDRLTGAECRREVAARAQEGQATALAHLKYFERWYGKYARQRVWQL